MNRQFVLVLFNFGLFTPHTLHHHPLTSPQKNPFSQGLDFWQTILSALNSIYTHFKQIKDLASKFL